MQATENTGALITKLKSSSHLDTLIVTSIQKMSNIKQEEAGINVNDIEEINRKRLVFIIDEAHRSTFGDMLITIKDTFPKAIFFGFTGTPIQDENQKKGNTTSTVFGNELHRYSIADGIRDKNILGFDPYKVLTYKDKDLRTAVALEQAKADTIEEAVADQEKAKIYYKFMDASKLEMTGFYGNDGKYVKGIEDYLSNAQYKRLEHKRMVVQDIKDNWVTYSHNNKFHAIFATSSIPEAIEYYRLLKVAMQALKTTCLFDANIDNKDGFVLKESGLVEIIKDYDERYEQDFTVASHAAFKKDIALRLAHKKPYHMLDKTPEKQIDLLIVVDQMLTGYDSKWINTLYLDKVLQYENIIQAFSRTNRLFGPEKPFGTIRYYKKPHTMERNIEDAVKSYSGDKPIGLFVQKLRYNIGKLNSIYNDIFELFKNANISNFERLPEEHIERAKFASLFKELNAYLEAAKIQGLKWSQNIYEFEEDCGYHVVVTLNFNENIYLILAQRYKELNGNGSGGNSNDIPFDIEGYLTEIDTDKINEDYMNTRFDKFLKILRKDDGVGELIDQALNELHKTFAGLLQEEQKYANIFLHDVQCGEAEVEEGKSFRDYITEYQHRAKNDQIYRCAVLLGLDEVKLRNMMGLKLTEININEYGRFDELKKSVDKEKAKEYFERIEGSTLIPPKVNMKVDKLLREFILSGGFEIE